MREHTGLITSRPRIRTLTLRFPHSTLRAAPPLSWAQLYLLLKWPRFSRSQGWLSFRGSTDKVSKLGQKLGLWQLLGLAGLQLKPRLEPPPASIKGQSITGSGLDPRQTPAPRGTMQGLAAVPVDQSPRGGDRGQGEARCWGGSWGPQR